nr:MAG TPA: hypothetical protein [Caudoviricetes sp.]
MRCLNRNKKTFYYALYKGEEEITDEDGNLTGEYEVKYEDPVKCKGNISAAKGEITINQFGYTEDYDKIIVLDNINTKISVGTVLWIDKIPEQREKGKIIFSYDYIVKKVAKSLNFVSIAVKKVSINAKEEINSKSIGSID